MCRDDLVRLARPEHKIAQYISAVLIRLGSARSTALFSDDLAGVRKYPSSR